MQDHDYYSNRRDIQKFKQLAAQRDIPALEEFANMQVSISGFSNCAWAPVA
jgi:hypothetical protein